MWMRTWLGVAVVVVPVIMFPGGAAAQSCTDDFNAVVREMYQQILEREPDRDARLLLYDIGTGRGTVRDNVAGLAKSAEHQARFLWPPIVEAIFRVTRGAQPHGPEVEQAAAALATGKMSVADVVSWFAANEAQTAERDIQVTVLYRRLLGRNPSPEEVTSWQSMIDRQGPENAARGIVASPEYKQQFGEQGVPLRGAEPYERSVDILYRHVLGREPDRGGLSTHAQYAAMAGFVPVIDALLNSQEYLSRFGTARVPGPGNGRAEYCGAPADGPQPRIARPRR